MPLSAPAVTRVSDSGQRSQVHPPRRKRIESFTAFLRNQWRRLTSMKTALMLLFLLTIAALPGALLPQWSTSRANTLQFIIDHPEIGPWLNRLGFFNVFSSPWFAAVYLLLFISLIGCVTPRSREIMQQIRQGPRASAPRNLSRLPHHAVVAATGDVSDIGEYIRGRLRRTSFGRWRTAMRREPNGTVIIAAEKGYLRDVGNLSFHISLLALLLSTSIGSLFGYEGSVIITEGEGFCASSPIAFDDFRPGALVDATTTTPFCIDVDAFHATYTQTGLAASFQADIRFQIDAELGTENWQHRALEVNDPLRFSGERLYLMGHGYTPTFRVAFPNGETRNYAQPFLPSDSLFTSEGAIKVTDPPGYTQDQLLDNQLAVVGIFAPTAVLANDILSSGYPSQLNPGVSVEIYRGDLGMADGRPQSVFAIDNNQVTRGLLVKQAQAFLAIGQSTTLDDGTEITFTGAKEFVSVQISYDPAQGWALVSILVMIAGLMASLLIKRRRLWYRIQPGSAQRAERSGSVVIEVGGLARTDQAGYGREFSDLVAFAEQSAAVTGREPRTIMKGQ